MTRATLLTLFRRFLDEEEVYAANRIRDQRPQNLSRYSEREHDVKIAKRLLHEFELTRQAEAHKRKKPEYTG